MFQYSFETMFQCWFNWKMLSTPNRSSSCVRPGKSKLVPVALRQMDAVQSIYVIHTQKISFWKEKNLYLIFHFSKIRFWPFFHNWHVSKVWISLKISKKSTWPWNLTLKVKSQGHLDGSMKLAIFDLYGVDTYLIQIRSSVPVI